MVDETEEEDDLETEIFGENQSCKENTDNLTDNNSKEIWLCVLRELLEALANDRE